MSDKRNQNETTVYEHHPRQYKQGKRDFSWLIGILIGLIITGVGLYFAWNFSQNFLDEPILDATPIEPTIERLPAQFQATEPPSDQDWTQPSPIPTFTPVPLPPGVLGAGAYARVANTEEIGVTLRGGPSTDNSKILVLPEDEILLIIDGPEESNGYTWWQVQRDDGTDGWAVEIFLEPASAEEANASSDDS